MAAIETIPYLTRWFARGNPMVVGERTNGGTCSVRARAPRTLSCACALLAAVLATTGAAPARAAPPTMSASDTAALKKFEEGKKAYDAGKLDEALVSFQASIALLPSPNTRLYIARCQRAIGRIGSAYVSYKLAIREAIDRLAATGEKRYQATREAAEGEIAEIESKVPRVKINVPGGVPADFRVEIDGVVLPREAWGTAIEIDPGQHAIKASGARRKSFAKTLEVSEGEQKVVDVVAERIPSGTLQLAFSSKPNGMSVQIDGVAIDPASVDAAKEVDAGAHEVEVRAPGHLSFVWKGQVEDQKETRVDVALTPSATVTSQGGAGVPLWLAIAVGGATIGTLAAGTIVASRAKSLADDQRAKDPLERDPDEKERVKRLSMTANILFVAGSALAVGTGVLLYLSRPSAARGQESARGGAWIAVTPSSVWLEGRF